MYHHFLSRAVFSSLRLSRILFVLLIQHFAQSDESMVFGIDETIERSRGRRINALGVYQRSSMVKVSGLRWVSLMWLATIHGRATLALCRLCPPCSVRNLPPCRRSSTQEDHRLSTPDDTPTATLAALELLFVCQSLKQQVTFISRLRLREAHFEPPLVRLPKQIGRTHIKRHQLPSLIDLLDREDVDWDLAPLVWPDDASRVLFSPNTETRPTAICDSGLATRPTDSTRPMRQPWWCQTVEGKCATSSDVHWNRG